MTIIFIEIFTYLKILLSYIVFLLFDYLNYGILRYQPENERYIVNIFSSNGEIHTIHIPLGSRGPSKLFTVTDNYTNKDITNIMKKLLGPCKNFYGIPTTPKLLGFKGSLTFLMMNGSNKTFQINEIITI